MKAYLILAGAALAATTPAQAVTVLWADWDSSTTTNVSGTLATPTPVSIEFDSPSGFSFVQTGSGTNFWTEPDPASRPYTGGIVENAPPASELIALHQAGEKTITFGAPISGLYLALISWNGNAAQFDQPFEIISYGRGFWGTGTASLGVDNTLVANGELHGIIYFPGTFSSLTFTDLATENWHGLTIGVAGLAPPIPEPASWAMMIAGFALAGGAMRARPRMTPALA